MTKEQIEQATSKYAASLWDKECIDSSREFDSVCDAFTDGANWRINSVWHSVEERPDCDKAVIIESTEIGYSFHKKGYDGPWKYNVEQFGFIRWAYIEDLLPNKED
jgi:hypothetical protein